MATEDIPFPYENMSELLEQVFSIVNEFKEEVIGSKWIDENGKIVRITGITDNIMVVYVDKNLTYHFDSPKSFADRFELLKSNESEI